MKRYLLSSLSVSISLIAFSFSIPEKSPRTTFDFRFTGDVTNQALIENEANWVHFTGAPQCDGIHQVVCELLYVPENYTEVVNGVRKMKNSVDIRSAIAFGAGTTRHVYFVFPLGVTRNNNTKW
jgi:hypothetical protein